MTESNPDTHAIAERALGYVKAGDCIGLGTGRAATSFLHALADKVRGGLAVRGVPTSEATAQLAVRLGVPLTDFEQVERLQIAVDGADEVDPNGDLIKGLGGALVREKVVASSADKLIILVGGEKLVDVLGSRGKLPIEVVPFALSTCRRRLEQLGLSSTPREKDGRLFLSDNGNPILDAAVSPLPDPAALERKILAIPGVVGTGLFLGMRPTILVQSGDDVRVLSPAS